MPPINRIAGIILAAGNSSRLGRPKQLLEFRGKTLLRRATESAIAAELSPILVMLGDDPAGAIAAEVNNLLVHVIPNPEWHLGMGTSIRIAMKCLAPFAPLRGVAVMLCDQPLVTAAALRRLIEIFSRQPSRIVASAYSEIVGVPAVFGPESFPELVALEGAQGAKSIIHRHISTLQKVLLPEAALDIDSPAAYARLLEMERGA